MKVSVESHIDVAANIKKIRNPEFWKFGANEWWKLISPYTPMNSGNLFENVEMNGEYGIGTIKYKSIYSVKVYNGKGFYFRKDKHPLACAEWDKAAVPQQKDKLITAMQKYIDSGKLK